MPDALTAQSTFFKPQKQFTPKRPSFYPGWVSCYYMAMSCYYIAMYKIHWSSHYKSFMLQKSVGASWRSLGPHEFLVAFQCTQYVDENMREYKLSNSESGVWCWIVCNDYSTEAALMPLERSVSVFFSKQVGRLVYIGKDGLEREFSGAETVVCSVDQGSPVMIAYNLY